MNIEDPKALHFMMQDDVFLLKKDREKYDKLIPVANVTQEEIDPPVVKSEIKHEFTFKGKKGELLILVYYNGHEFIDEAHLAALERILNRKNLAIADVALLNRATHADADYPVLLEYFSPGKILILGERSLPAGILPLTLNQTVRDGEKSILYSFSFDEMMDNPDNKKAFWEQMNSF